MKGLVLCAIGCAACVSSEGDVFRATSAALPCAGAPFVIDQSVGAGPLWGGSSFQDGTPGGISFSQGRTTAYQLNGLSVQAAPSIMSWTLDAASQLGTAQPLSDQAGTGWLVFPNHSLAGQWNVYAARWRMGEATVATPFVRVSETQGVVENIGPRAAVLGARLGIAYRQDARLAFAVVEAGTVLGVTANADMLPHPVVRRVLAGSAGFTVLYERSTASLASFAPDGVATGVLDLGSPTADAVVTADRLIVVTAQAAAVEKRDLSSLSALPPGIPLGISVTGQMADLRVATTGGWLAVTFTERDAPGGPTRLRFAWNASDRTHDYPALPIQQADDGILDVMTTSAGALVVYDSGGVLYGRLYCTP